MMTEVMMFGGHRDGQILEVPGGIEPDARIVRITLRGDTPIFDQMAEVPKKIVDLEIVPRKADSGPAWKIDLPKELW